MYTTHLEVNIKLLITVETDTPFEDTPEDQVHSIVVDNSADLISQYDDSDLGQAIVDWKVIDTEST